MYGGGNLNAADFAGGGFMPADAETGENEQQAPRERRDRALAKESPSLTSFPRSSSRISRLSSERWQREQVRRVHEKQDHSSRDHQAASRRLG